MTVSVGSGPTGSEPAGSGAAAPEAGGSGPGGGEWPSVFDRYRSEGSGLFDLERRDERGRLAPTPHRPHYDEMIDGAGAPRPAWGDIVRGYGRRGDDRLRRAAGRLAGTVRDEGVVYNPPVADDTTTSARDWRIDAAPLIVDGGEWVQLEKAITQRSMLLDAILRDLYHDQKTITRGLIPPEMVFGHPGYIRKAARLSVPGPHALFLHAVDLARTPSGRFEVYGDRTQAPSGIGFAIVDRRLLSRTFPLLFQTCAPRAMTTFAGTLRLALFDYAPPGVDDPTVAVLSPGSMSETAFDQAYLASVLGFPLVEGADLTVRDGALYMRSLGKFKRVDVLLRRVDATFVDPLDLRTDSRLGVAGLVEAISRGTVSVVNTLGSGVLENPALHTIFEAAAPALLDEELALPSVPTWWAGDDSQRTKILTELDHLVLTNTRTGEEMLGPQLDSATRSELADRIGSQGSQWVGREMQSYSVAPSMIPGERHNGAAGIVRAAPVSIRAFSVAQGPTYAVMPGGLGAVLADGPGAGALHTVAAKDIWVTNAEVGGHVSRRTETRTEPAEEVVALRPGRIATAGDRDAATGATPRVLADMFWFGRYGERTELVTRLAKVSRERYQDFQYRPWMTGTAAVPLFLDAIATVTGTAAHLRTAELVADDTRVPSPEQVEAAIETIAELTIARSVPGSLAHSAERLVATARAVRDQLSTSTWMVLTPVERALSEAAQTVSRSSAGSDVEDVDVGTDLAHTHDEILHGVLALAGLQAESMVRDAGWLFMDLGRRIERVTTVADLTTATLAEIRDPDVEQALLEAYLAANESSVIHRRRNRGLIQITSVLELLLFDESNPRALIYQLDRIRDDLVSLPESLRLAGAERHVAELIAQVRRTDPADLVDRDTEGRREDLATLMTALADGARELSDMFTRTRFARQRPGQPLWGSGGEFTS